MKLQTLKPKLAALNPNRIKVLDAKAGTTPRMQGGKWTRKRKQVLIDGMFTCVDCGRVSIDNEIDHDTPLEQGGTHDDDNLKIRCVDCHKAKTAREASIRAGRAT